MKCSEQVEPKDETQFPYITVDSALGEQGYMPLLPLSLATAQQSVSVMGLLDSGSTVNVMPYDLGLQLGADWKRQTIPIELAGNLRNAEARALLVRATVASFPPVELAFAWTKSNSVPLLLGQVNFFKEFGVCFFRSKLVFDVRPK